jgi:hypothetical protein
MGVATYYKQGDTHRRNTSFYSFNCNAFSLRKVLGKLKAEYVPYSCMPYYDLWGRSDSRENYDD